MASLNSIFVCAFLLFSITSYSKAKTCLTDKEAANYLLTSANTSPSELVIPFKLVKKLIVVKAFVDGKMGYFIVDTGSKHLVLNSRFFTGKTNYEFQTIDFAGAAASFQEKIVKFGWDKSNEKKYLAIITPFGSLETILGAAIMGYIGYDILKDFEVVFDYKESEITLFKLDKKGKRESIFPMHTDATDTIQLKSNYQLPYLTINLGDQELKLGIDSGASFNLVRTKKAKKINDHFQHEGFEQIAGFNGKIILSPSGYLRKLKVNNLHLSPMKCIVKDMMHLNRTLRTKLDGLLGFEFLKQYKISINYRKNEMYIWNPEILHANAIATNK